MPSMARQSRPRFSAISVISLSASSGSGSGSGKFNEGRAARDPQLCGLALFVGALFAVRPRFPISHSSVQAPESRCRWSSFHSVGFSRRPAEQPEGFPRARPPSQLRHSSPSRGRGRSAPPPSPELDGRAIDKREFPQAFAEPPDRRTCQTQMHWLIPQGGRYSPK